MNKWSKAYADNALYLFGVARDSYTFGCEDNAFLKPWQLLRKKKKALRAMAGCIIRHDNQLNYGKDARP